MPELYVGTSPHIADSASTARIMGHVLIALVPCAACGVVLYGLPALAVLLVTTAASAAGEALFRLVTRQENRVRDCSAVVSGLLLALVLPPGIPLWMAALGGVFAVVVAKEFFGGLGANVFNPALCGRAFLLMSFPTAMTNWTAPGRAWSGLDALSAATPLEVLRSTGSLAETAYSIVPGAGADNWYGEMIKTLFIGSRSGSIGESSILLILAGCLYLLVTRVIDWRAPLAMIVSAVILSAALGMDPLFALLSGGFMFGAVFMATDYVSAPLTAKGKLLFGAGAGIIAILIRQADGGYPEGVSYGILIMNAATPFLNRLLQKKYGYVKPGKAAAAPTTEKKA